MYYRPPTWASVHHEHPLVLPRVGLVAYGVLQAEIYALMIKRWVAAFSGLNENSMWKNQKVSGTVSMVLYGILNTRERKM